MIIFQTVVISTGATLTPISDTELLGDLVAFHSQSSDTPTCSGRKRS